MSNLVLERPKINRQELIYYLLFGTIFLFSILITGLSIWFYSGTAEPSPWVTVGQVADFPTADENGVIRPYKIPLSDSNYVWITNNEGEIRAFSPYTTWGYTHERGCIYGWNTATDRFVDPCTGSKYRLDGVIISGPATRDLDQYTVAITNGEIQINTNQLTAGQCRELYTGSTRQARYAVWRETPPVCSELNER